MNPLQVSDIIRTSLKFLIARVRMEIRNGTEGRLAGTTVLSITSYKGQSRGRAQF